MARRLQCPCGEGFREETDDELVAKVRTGQRIVLPVFARRNPVSCFTDPGVRGGHVRYGRRRCPPGTPATLCPDQTARFG